MTGKNLTGGKKLHATASSEPSQEYDPLTIVDRFLGHRASSVKAEVTGDVVLNKGIAAFRSDKEKLSRLLNALVEKRVLSKTDAELALTAKKSMFSMLTKIGEYADVILHEKIIPFLQPGYSVLYQLALLIETLEANDEQD
jgi:hypothetical protein